MRHNEAVMESLEFDAREELKAEELAEEELIKECEKEFSTRETPSEVPLPCGGCSLELVSQEAMLGPKCALDAYEAWGGVCTTCDEEIERGPVYNKLGLEGTGKLWQVCSKCHKQELANRK